MEKIIERIKAGSQTGKERGWKTKRINLQYIFFCFRSGIIPF